MTASAVSRKFVLILCAVLLIANFVFLAYAVDQPATVSSPLTQPVPRVVTTQNGIDVYIYFVGVANPNLAGYGGRNVLVEDVYHLTSNQNYAIALKSLFAPGLISDQIYSRTYNMYDVESGAFLETSTQNASSDPNAVRGTNWPTYTYISGITNGVGLFNNQPFYTIASIDGVPTGTNTLPNQVTPYVNWAAATIDQVYYHSVLPKPESDDYNRFVVITSANESHLLWLNYHFEFLYGVTTGAQQTVEYDIQQSDYYAPTFINSDDGFYFKLMMDPILYLYLQNLNFSGTVACNYTLSDYNLITGEFISMTSGNIEDLNPDVSYNLFNGYIEFDAVGIDLFGLNYEDHSTDHHLHRAAVIYSTDPDFERWKQSVLTWLENIYNVISATEAAEDVTIEQDTAAASELHQVIDNLQPTDENGSKVNTADVVSEQFSDAQQYISELSVGAGEFNVVVDDFLFSNPFFYIPLIVALAAGLLITILGKNKSND